MPLQHVCWSSRGSWTYKNKLYIQTTEFQCYVIESIKRKNKYTLLQQLKILLQDLQKKKKKQGGLLLCRLVVKVMVKQLRGIIVDCAGVNFIVPASKCLDQLAIYRIAENFRGVQCFAVFAESFLPRKKEPGKFWTRAFKTFCTLYLYLRSNSCQRSARA